MCNGLDFLQRWTVMRYLICGAAFVLGTMLAIPLATAHPPEFHQHGSRGESEDGTPAADHLAVYLLTRFGEYDERYFDATMPDVAVAQNSPIRKFAPPPPGGAAPPARPAAVAPAGKTPAELSPEGLEFQRRAFEAFRNSKFADAVRLAGHGIVEMPREGRLYLFLSQALLATGDYRTAAAAAHQGMSLLKPQEWGHIVEHYKDYYPKTEARELYTKHMQGLTTYSKKHPKSASARFLLAYHYSFWGERAWPAARVELVEVLRLESTDAIAARLLNRLDGVAGPDADLPPSARAFLAKLPEADRVAAIAQRTCPVTDDLLGADGTPIKVRIRDRDVFVCCTGCVTDLRKDPVRYLGAEKKKE